MSRAKTIPHDIQYRPAGKDAATSKTLRKRLEADLDAFQALGGRIEVLAITRPRDRRDEPDDGPG